MGYDRPAASEPLEGLFALGKEPLEFSFAAFKRSVLCLGVCQFLLSCDHACINVSNKRICKGLRDLSSMLSRLPTIPAVALSIATTATCRSLPYAHALFYCVIIALGGFGCSSKATGVGLSFRLSAF